MTLSNAEREARRGPQRRERTAIGAFAAAFESIAATAHTLSWPSIKYQEDPAAFARDILGVRLWHRQVEIIEAVRDNTKVTVRSGHKIGKGMCAATLALWFYSSFPRARVVLTSTTAKQVDGILWREVQILKSQSGTCLDCRDEAERLHPDRPEYPRPCPHSAVIDGDIHELARSGLKSNDFREIIGTTASEAEAMAGTSGANLLYIADEASGIPDFIFEAIDGNMAGGAKLAMFSNPTKTDGRFYESHKSEKRDLYKQIHVSSIEAAKTGIPGLATQDWIVWMAAEHGGTDSGEFLIRVKGEFAPTHTQKVIPLSLIDEAIERWARTVAEGPLVIGVDVARFGDDDTAIAARRGKKVLEIVTKNGLDEHGVTQLTLELADKYRAPREFCTINVDAAGVGIPVVIELNKQRGHYNKIVGIHPGQEARQPGQFHSMRDQLWFSTQLWLRGGGALPPDQRLAEELHAPRYSFDDARNRKRVESKDITRKQIKRSPDRADAVNLACWDEGESQHTAVRIPHPAEVERPRTSAIYGPRHDEGGGSSIYGASGGPTDGWSPTYGPRRR